MCILCMFLYISVLGVYSCACNLCTTHLLYGRHSDTALGTDSEMMQYYLEELSCDVMLLFIVCVPCDQLRLTPDRRGRKRLRAP